MNRRNQMNRYPRDARNYSSPRGTCPFGGGMRRCSNASMGVERMQMRAQTQAQERDQAPWQGQGCSLCRQRSLSLQRQELMQEDNMMGGGCGCEHGTQVDRERLLQQIRTVDFALYEVVLYLDAYPHAQEALDTYHKLLCRRKDLYEQYERTYGPVTVTGNSSHNSWDWIEKPFPWEPSAN